MTEKWYAKRYHTLRSKSAKAVPELGKMVDPSVSTVNLDKSKASSSVLPGSGVLARTQELLNRFINCPRCKQQVRLIPSKRPRTMQNIDSILLECSSCGLWYKSSKWCTLEADTGIRKWYANNRIDFRRREVENGNE